ncbi:hypothetical protein BTVI_44166 [Pitangus sulphuratus]|nr:hypothetical protein BTVI_44166 [Pitangus sulphuratus]
MFVKKQSPGHSLLSPGGHPVHLELTVQGWKQSPTICHRLIQIALKKDKGVEHLKYIDYIIIWGNTEEEVFEKGEKIIQILLKANFAIKERKVKEIQVKTQ